MCGIVGIINRQHSLDLGVLMNRIAHRGPDSSGFYHDDYLSFGHLRLAIQDLTPSGHQPMISSDGRFVLILNGEIYNHNDIRQPLLSKYSFKSSGDTETVLYAFMEYGVSVFSMLNGIFALALYDITESKVYLVRDQFGVKPLYYSNINNQILFSSEIKSFLDHPEFKRDVSNTYLANYLSFLYSPGEKTPFNNVNKILPGHYITVKKDVIETFKYYEIPFNGEYENRTESQWIDLLDQKLTEAVKRQLLSDVPIGFFLSGGLDSSLIVAIANKILPDQRLKCFTIDTAMESNREGFSEDLPYAKRVAEFLNVDLEIVKADIDILHDFDKMVYHLDEPQADAAPLNVMNICKKAREQGRIVLLGGTAGDDLFSGYRRHQAIDLDKKLKFIPHRVKNILWKFSGFLPLHNAKIRRIRKLLSLYKESNKQRQFASMYAWLEDENVKKLFNENFEFDPASFLIKSLENIPNEKSLLNQLLFWDMKFFLPDHNLNYTDKMSMAHGIEVRVPFLDVDLVEFSTSIPPTLKMKGRETKYLLKKVAERYLPKDIIYRSKSGFGAPIRDWIINDLTPMIDDYLSKENIEKRGIFNFTAIEDLLENNRSGKIDASYIIWCLLAIESWMRQFVDRDDV